MTKEQAVAAGLRVFEPVECAECGWLMDPDDERTIEVDDMQFCEDCATSEVK